jgi:SAM-dependent methyltransferase
LTPRTKNWNDHVLHAELVARTPGFAHLREAILARAAVNSDDIVLDIGAGTGLLTLPLCERAAKVWAIDIAPSMCEYLRTKAASATHENLVVATASAASLPLVDESIDVAVSNYCFHHLDAGGKRVAIAEVHRVLRPGGRFVFGDMMFTLGVAAERDRAIIRQKMQSMLRQGPAGAVRLARNGLRIVSRRWEHPEPAAWWHRELRAAGFVGVDIEVLPHEGAIARARKAGGLDPDGGLITAAGEAGQPDQRGLGRTEV